MRFRLRDFVETVDGWFFSVVGYENSPKIKGFLRYIPDEGGDRINRFRKGRFRKLSSDEAIEYIRKNKPEYDFSGIHFIPHGDVVYHYRPDRMLYRAMVRNKKLRKVVKFFLPEIPFEDMGISGSMLIGMEKDTSDIDFVVYGKSWFVAREKLRRSMGEGIKEPDELIWKTIYEKRKPALSFEEFLIHERRKYMRGVIDGTYFDLLYVRKAGNHPVREKKGKVLGVSKIIARIVDDSFAFDYPSFYRVEHEEMSGILSFTHTFAGQAFKGELVEAKGKVEIIDGRKYLVIGSTREARDEYMKSLTLLEGKT